MNKAHLHLENIGLVRSADIALDGITVITGYNNTGKTTISKTLYAYARTVERLSSDYKADAMSFAIKTLDEAAGRCFDDGRDVTYYVDSPYGSMIQRDYASFDCVEDVRSFIDSLTADTGCPDSIKTELKNLQGVLSVDLESYAVRRYQDVLSAEFPSGCKSMLNPSSQALMLLEVEVGEGMQEVLRYTEIVKEHVFLVKDALASSMAFIDDVYCLDGFSAKASSLKGDHNALKHRDHLCTLLSQAGRQLSTF